MVDVDETYTSLWKDKQKAPRRKKTKPSSDDCSANTQSSSVSLTAPVISDPVSELLSKRIESLQLTPANNIKRRYLKQVFIRGDNVVSVYPVS